MTSGSTITNVGSVNNTISTYVIKDANGNDVTSNYNVTTATGTLTVNKTPTTTELANITKTYNGSTQAATGATAKYNSNNATISGAAFTYKYYTNNTCTAGETTTAPKDQGTYYVKAILTGTTNYESSSKCATYTMNKKNVTLTAGSTTRKYTQTVLTNSTCTAGSGQLVSGHTATCTMTSGSTITNVGSVNNTINTYVIKDASNNDVTSNYNVTKATGTLTVTQDTPTTTELAAITKTYNGSAQAASGATAKLSNGTTITSPTITYAYYSGTGCSGTAISAPTNAGTYSVKATLTGTTNYATSNVCATYTMNKKNITITAKAQTVDYGTAISQATSQVTVATLASGDSLTSITLTPSTTNAGTGTITPSAAVIKNGNGVDVSSSYNVTSYATGALTVNVYTCTAPAATTPSKIYNGSSQASGITCPTDNNCSTASGATSTNVGTQTQTCTLTDTSNYKWDDDTTDPKSYTWYINNAKVTFSKGSGTLTCDYVGAKPTPTTTADYVKYTRKGQTKLSASIRNTTYSTDIPVARKDGYTWNGWYTAASAGSKVVDYDSGTDAYTFYSVSGVSTASAWNMTANKTLYAQCTANTYKVYYYSGTTKLGESSHTYGTAKALTTYATLDSNGTYIPTGYNIPSEWSFAGWYKKSGSTTSGTTINYTDGQFVNNLTTTANDIIYLYAVYKRTITIRTGDSTSPVTYTQYYNPNASNPTSITLPAIASKSGWTSLGYRDDNDNGDINYGYEPNATVTIPLVNKPNLYAVYYKSNSATFYSGENQEYHESISGDAFYTATNGTEPTGAYITVPNTANPISDWTFTGGWSVDGSTTVAVHGDNGIELLFGETYNYYAIYEKDYTAYFYTGISKANTATQTGTVKYNTQTSTVPTTTTITLNGTPSSIGYDWTASGWRANTTAAAKSYNYSQSGVSININDSNKFYSIYTRTLTLTYDGSNNNLGNPPANQTATQYYNSNGSVSNEVFTVPATPSGFAKSGMTLTGWWSSPHQAAYQPGGNTGGYNPAVDESGTQLTFTLAAQWKEKTYVLAIDPRGGTYSGSTNPTVQTITYRNPLLLTRAAPTKAGYDFLRWYYFDNNVLNPSDPVFASGTSSMLVYDNNGAGTGTVALTRVSGTNPVAKPTSSYVMRWSRAGNTTATRPGLGGFKQTYSPSNSKQYIHVILARKITSPSLYMQYTSNGVGTGGSSEWLTNNTLTTDWQLYIYRITTGTSPGSFGYIYFTPTAKASGDALTGATGPHKVEIAYSAILDMSDADNDSRRYGIGQYDGDAAIAATYTPKVLTITLNNQSATNAGTTTIYEKYDNGYYRNYSNGSVSGAMQGSGAIGITKPTKTNYTFQGYFTSTGGGGKKIIGSDGKLITNLTNKEFSSSGTLYAYWTKNTVTTYNCNFTYTASNSSTNYCYVSPANFQYAVGKTGCQIDPSNNAGGYICTEGVSIGSGYSASTANSICESMGSGWTSTTSNGSTFYCRCTNPQYQTTGTVSTGYISVPYNTCRSWMGSPCSVTCK